MLNVNLETIPRAEGVYLFKNAKGEVLYVGKAKDLKARISSYFRGPVLSPKIHALLEQANSIDYFLTSNEKEALLLEATFIKKYRPKYNVLLRDDKNYPLLRLSLGEEYPALHIVRKRKKGDQALYFGPFTSARSLREILKLLSRTFPLRKCSISEMRRRKSPCVYYQIGKCLAPCVNKVSKEEYESLVKGVIDFFQGRGRELLQRMKKEMEDLAERMEFERAAFIRDRLRDIETILERQAVILSKPLDLDLWDMKEDKNFLYLIVLYVRYGHLYGYQTFRVKKNLSEDSPLREITLQFYLEGKVIPDRILLPELWENFQEQEELLSEYAGKRVILETLKEDEELKYLRDLATRNLQNFMISCQRRESPWYSGLADEIKRALRLKEEPRYIEAIDLSQYYGQARVGVIVGFFEGEPDKSRYRYFKIKGEGRDDFSMLYEVLTRRLKRGAEEKNLPDLILIDGGKGHLETALRAIEDLNLRDIEIRSIAKNEKREPDKVYLPGRKNPLFLPRYKEVYHFVGRVMSEAHRFALSFAERTLKKETLITSLDRIPGIGPKRREILLKRFKSLQEIKEAPLEALAKLPTFNVALAKKLKEALQRESLTTEIN
ncbi:MAG: excinuclease ABC subunit UvrC [Caldimicrobium sp.]|nr:excinuclease ABC subunit UvrC [Caldimicrobium sp.]